MTGKADDGSEDDAPVVGTSCIGDVDGTMVSGVVLVTAVMFACALVLALLVAFDFGSAELGRLDFVPAEDFSRYAVEDGFFVDTGNGMGDDVVCA